ncbi:hypothetical protein ACLOJK_008796 [Asimina triloba]
MANERDLIGSMDLESIRSQYKILVEEAKSLANALKESKKYIPKEERGEESGRGIEISPRGPKVTITEVDDENLVEVEGSLTLQVVISKAAVGQTARERRGQVSSPKVDLAHTSFAQDAKEIFERSFDMEARAIKILEDFFPAKSRVIQENVTLGLESTFNSEGRNPAELMLLKFLLSVWNELKDLNKRIRLIDGYSTCDV